MIELNVLARVRCGIIGCRRCPRPLAWRERSVQSGDWAAPVPGFSDPETRLHIAPMARVDRTRTATFLSVALHRTGLADIVPTTHRGDGLRLRDA